MKFKIRKSIFDNPVLKTKITSANVKPKEAILGYLLGPFCALIANSIFGMYLNQYFNNVLGMTTYSPAFATLMPMFSVIFVIIGNLVVGQFIEKTRTEQGKARPYLLLSIPLMIIAMIVLFVGPRENSAIQLVWIAISFNLYSAIAYPCYYASHSSMVGLSTRNSQHRGILATFSNASGVMALGIGASIIFPIFQGLVFVQNPDGTINTLESYNAWRMFVIVLCVVTTIGIILEYYFTRERITEESIKLNIEKKSISMKQQFKAVTMSKDWWIVILYFFLFQMGGTVKNGSMGYYCYAMFGAATTAEAGSLQGTLGLIGGIPTALGIVLAWPIASKLGKRNAMAAGFVFSVLGGLVSFIDTGNFALVCTGVILKGIGSIPAMYVSLALLSDVLDHLEAQNGFRSDGFTMSVYGAVMIGLSGLGTGIVNAILGVGGYDFQNLCVQSESAKNSVTWCFLGIELICYGILAVLLLFTNVEKYVEEDHKIILENQKAAVLASGEEWIDPAERLRREQEEADRISENERIRELKAYCKKKGLDFEQQEEKYQIKQQKKRALVTSRANKKKK